MPPTAVEAEVSVWFGQGFELSQFGPVLIDFQDGPGDIVHVFLGSEQDVLRQADRLRTEGIVIGTLVLLAAAIKLLAGVHSLEILGIQRVLEERLPIQGAVSPGTWDPFGAERGEELRPGNAAELLRVIAERIEVVGRPRDPVVQLVDDDAGDLAVFSVRYLAFSQRRFDCSSSRFIWASRIAA